MKEIAKTLPQSTPIEIWFQDEMRIGQKNGIARLWARKGTRPRQPSDQRYENAYIFGAICPARGTGAALVRPYCDTEAMQAHLLEISLSVETAAHAIVLVDRAGWHTTAKLQIPENISSMCLPSKSPELNPQENVWQYMRQNWLSNRVFEDYAAILYAACDAWNKLIKMPHVITSIGTREWAKNGQ